MEEASPVPWPLFLVMFTSVFSVLIYGFAVLFRSRPRFEPRSEPAPDDLEPPDAPR